MPANALNTAFVADPGTFLANADRGIAGHDDLVQAVAGVRASTLTLGTAPYQKARGLVSLFDGLGVASFDLVPYEQGDKKGLLLRPVFDATLFTLGGDAATGFPAAPTNPIRGHWFPYVTGVGKATFELGKATSPEKAFGWVDIKQTAPDYDFAFTGSMQGCHLCVTLSPAHPTTHFRVWHIQSPGSYRKTASANVMYQNWPASLGGRIVAYLDDAEYCHEKPTAVDAFNFLHYSGGSWRIVTQKLSRHTLFTGARSAIIVLKYEAMRISDPIPRIPLETSVLTARYEAWSATYT